MTQLIERRKILINGIVQGVGFRPTVYRYAKKFGLMGFVANTSAGVIIEVQGARKSIDDFLNLLTLKPPVLAEIHSVTQQDIDVIDENDFRIVQSEATSDTLTLISPDISICDQCRQELFDTNNRRFGYPFINCTNCGPRYTIIKKIPYDRPYTTMSVFEMCDDCKAEYSDPENRRFHAQPDCCPVCGPEVWLADNKGKRLIVNDPITGSVELLKKGYIIAVKGLGGFHLACDAENCKAVELLRQRKGRYEKPLAVMTFDIENAEQLAYVSQKEKELLTSGRKPIVILRKKKDHGLCAQIAPLNDFFGIMLPYTPLHCLLLKDFKALVMTSGNYSDEPISKDNNEALKRLGGVVDYFLFHNRRIAHRCDDSVLRVHGGRHVCLIRRSRGYAPAPIRLKFSSKKCILGLGGELNVVSCILNGDKAFLSQHIGDVENIETLGFLEEASRHLIRLTNSHIEAIACDLHPRFNTTRLAYRLAKEWNCPVIQVQHHHAHIAALMAEHNLDEIIGIACDGYGYGPNGQAWGGEILYCNREGYRRVGHLEEQPMPGGDLATRYPLRMAAGILHRKADISEWLLSKSSCLPHGKAEAELILKQLEKGVRVKTSSCGRILDAVSAILGICYERTYEGEPAMKLEAAAIGGKDVLKLKPKIKGEVIETSDMVYTIFENVGKLNVRDLAYSAQQYLARSLAELAIEKALELGVKYIGFSGGVACNEQITLTIQKIVEGKGLNFVFHRAVPPGDGGTSFGQAIVACFKLGVQ